MALIPMQFDGGGVIRDQITLTTTQYGGAYFDYATYGLVFKVSVAINNAWHPVLIEDVPASSQTRAFFYFNTATGQIASLPNSTLLDFVICYTKEYKEQ